MTMLPAGVKVHLAFGYIHAKPHESSASGGSRSCWDLPSPAADDGLGR
jgi:hypothetical protein